MLEIKNLTISYGGNTPVVKDFELSVAAGEIVTIVGESGSGKTTVIRSIHGLLPGGGAITAGEIRFNGGRLDVLTQSQWRKIRGTEISMIFQDSGSMLNQIQTVGKQFIEYIRIHRDISKEEAAALATRYLSKMNLHRPEMIMKSYPFQLSGGMRQRVGIAMAMVFNPSLLLADEPTSALDVTTQAQIISEMMKLREEYNTAIVLVTHNLGVAAYISDKIVVLKDGLVVEAGTREQVIDNPQADYTKTLLAAVPELSGESYAS